MSNHVGMVMREDVADWQSQWTPRASAQVGSESLRMQHNGLGEIRVTLGNTELYRGTDIDAAIKAWDGAGDKSRLGDRRTIANMPPLYARAVLKPDSKCVIEDAIDGWWQGMEPTYTRDRHNAIVCTVADVERMKLGASFIRIHALVPD